MRWYDWILTKKAQDFILIVIIINAITLGLETSTTAMAAAGGLLIAIDMVALAIFTVELIMKGLALRSRFFKDPWNIFDFVIVGIAYIPAAGPLTVLRALRILRALRLVSAIPKLRRIVLALLQAMPSIGWISLLLLIEFYIFAVIGVKLFGAAFPDWFGTLGETYYSLFQILTLESWSMGIARPVMEQFPLAWLYFVPFVLITSFVVLNVFIAVIVGAMSDVKETERQEQATADATQDAPKGAAVDPVALLGAELYALRAQMDKVDALYQAAQTAQAAAKPHS